MGEYRIRKTETGFVFHLRANNRQGIGVSQTYVSLNGCKNGTKTVRKNCRSKVEDQTLQVPEVKKHPKYEVYLDKDEAFRFRLKASNGQNVLGSQAYTTKSACLNGIESVMNHAPDAVVVIVDFDEKQDDDALFDEIPVATPIVKKVDTEKPIIDEVTNEVADETVADDFVDETKETDNEINESAVSDEVLENTVKDESISTGPTEETDNRDSTENNVARTEVTASEENGTQTVNEEDGSNVDIESIRSAEDMKIIKWYSIRKRIFWYFRKQRKS